MEQQPQRLNPQPCHLLTAQVGPAFPPLASAEGPLQYEEVASRLDEGMAWLAGLYCNTMNVIHYMHDKYSYERLQVGFCLQNQS